MKPQPFFTISNQHTPLLAFALHDGHEVDDVLRPHLLLNEPERSREEDPYTAFMISDLPVTTVTVRSSRFQLDLNRTREKAIYQKPEDAWGLNVWEALPETAVADLHQSYDQFYKEVGELLEETIARHGRFLVLDIHSYNHRRDSVGKAAPEATHPEINMGTFYNKQQWRADCEAFTRFLSEQEIQGHHVDVRENIIFKGGAFAQWVIENYGSFGAVFSIEFKKTFMDEWTGVGHIPHILQLKELLAGSVDFIQQHILPKNP
ncbi:N-formylglutamate amidohydrolase [Niabella insulamsoli]|uniref:N-formylglutamate amidohydrolase n=1 Tax=Niabella insulamsoli TaxID=3144874 RepID=UPI0031FCD904